jgi:hypothetical protein
MDANYLRPVSPRFAHVPAPPDAQADDLTDWTLHDDGRYRRAYMGWARTLTLASGRSVFVDVDGEQFDDGSVRRTVTVEGAEGMNAAEARQVAHALITAAEELWNRSKAVDGGARSVEQRERS